MQDCWRGQAVVRAFLGGPLHAELAAVQVLPSSECRACSLQSSTCRAGPSCVPPGGHSRVTTAGAAGWQSASGRAGPGCEQGSHAGAGCARGGEGPGHVARSLEADMLATSREDLTCPICMARPAAVPALLPHTVGRWQAAVPLPPSSNLQQARRSAGAPLVTSDHRTQPTLQATCLTSLLSSRALSNKWSWRAWRASLLHRACRPQAPGLIAERAQDLMYEPAALACGHTFCGRCCVSAAGYSAEQVRSWRDLAAVDTSAAACPLCRRMHGGRK